MGFEMFWMRRRAALAGVRIVLAVAAIASLHANAAGFIEAPPLTAARASHSATMLPDGEVLVAGGAGAGGILASSELYDQTLDSWRPAASLNVARYGHTATLLPSGFVLATGGWGGGIMTATTELYDWITDSWSPASPMSVKRINHTATLLQSGKVLVCGGQNTEDFTLASCETYDALANIWLPAASMATPRSSHTATLLPSGKVLFVGGYNGVYLSSAEIYDPDSDTFSPAASMVVPRYSHTATLMQTGWVLIVGGANAPGATSAVEIYDPVLDHWRSAESLPQQRTLHAATTLATGEVLVVGGGLVNTAVTDAEIFNPFDETWRSAGHLFQGRFTATATALAGDSVLIVGGRDVSPYLASVEKYLREGDETVSTIAIEPEPSHVGESFQVTVTVSAPASSDVPTGTVVVGDNGGASCGSLTLVSGTATCAMIRHTDGPIEVSADYTPDDARFEPSSTSVSHNVVEAETHLAITSHTPDPSLPFAPVTVTVDFGVTPPGAGDPHGGIWISDGSGAECVIPEGESSCDMLLSVRGPRTLTATYSGDGDFNPSSATATHHVNRLPVAPDDSYSTLEDMPLTVSASDGVLHNDIDEDGDALTVVSVGEQTAGGIGGTVALNADGSFSYMPPPDANGTADFGYTVSDGFESVDAHVTLTVVPVNDAPEFSISKHDPFPPGTFGEQTIPGAVTIVSMGAPDEADQAVLAWHVRIVDDAEGVLTAVPTISSDGTLHFLASGHGGIAVIAIALQDDGGTENDGQDTSAEQFYYINIAASTDLAISIDDGLSFVGGGDQPVYLILVSNVGIDAPVGAIVRVQSTLSALVDEHWTCTPDPGAACTASGSGDISDDAASIPPGATLVYELTGTVNAIPEQPLRLDATVLVWIGPPDANLLNNNATDIDVIGVFADGFDTADGSAGDASGTATPQIPATKAHKQ